MKFFPTSTRSACSTNFSNFQAIQFKAPSKRVKLTPFESRVIRFEKTKEVNPDVARAIMDSRSRRARAENAAKNYSVLNENPTAKVKSKGGVRYIDKRESGRFAGRIVLAPV